METLRALAVLLDVPVPAHVPVARALGLTSRATPDEHTNVLVFQAYPYASVYLGLEGMLGGDARDRVAGFWRALGAEPDVEVDHLGVLLAASAHLAELEHAANDGARARIRSARHALFWEHIASWMPPYLGTVRRIAGDFYAGWADLAEVVLAAEAEAVGPPTRLVAHHRAIPPLPSDVENLDALLALLLAPARVGFTLVRDDLLRAARALGLGARVGERRYALRSMLAQDATAVLDWLAAEAHRQATCYELSPLSAVASWWIERARAGAGWIAQRARDAGALASRECA